MGHRIESRTPEISIEQYAAEQAQGVTIDVREKAEYAQAHVPGAVLVPMGQLASRIGEIDRSPASTSSAPPATARRR